MKKIPDYMGKIDEKSLKNRKKFKKYIKTVFTIIICYDKIKKEKVKNNQRMNA